MRIFGKIILGLLASIGFVVIVLTAVVIYGIAQFEGGRAPMAKAPDKIILTLDLDEGLAEGAGRRIDGFSLGGAPSLQDAVIALRRARDDRRVVAVAARLSHSPLGMAQTEDLRDLIKDFRSSGKPALLFSETIGETIGTLPTYYLATAFGELWVQPSGTVGVAGIGTEQPFLKDFLARFGVQASFLSRKEYKSAAESLTNAEMSDANREALEGLLGTWFEQMVLGTAADRGIAPEAMKALVDGGPLPAPEALAAGLIDHIGYFDEFEDALEAVGGGAEEMTLGRYLALPRPGDRAEPTRSIAVIHGLGQIVRGEGQSGLFGDAQVIGSETMSKAIRDAAGDDDIDAILIRVDSPGGSYVASDTIWREVVRARDAGKPVIVSMGNTAASGGYFIAMGADRIFAQPSTVTGSIGVLMGKLVLGGAFEMLDVSWDRVTFGDSAGMFSPVTDFTPAERARLDHMLDTVYADFTQKAADGRGKDVADLEQLARGRVWSGADAASAGLVDELGGFSRAIDYTKELIGLGPDEPAYLVPFPPPKDPWETLLEALRDGSLPFGLMNLVRAAAWVGGILQPAVSDIAAAQMPGPLLYAPAMVVK